jgi:hypothetical protein
MKTAMVSPSGAAEAVPQPDRSGTGVLDGKLLDRLEGRAGRPVAWIAASDVQFVELGRGDPARKQRVARNLPGRIRDHPDSEGRLER